ncbi:MAG: hypothetical protein RLZ98_1372 [Pseudomonadota bacterium]|jgi:acyl dehydratase
MSEQKDYYFEDFAVGMSWRSERYTVSEEEMLEFARRYVPLSYHADPEAAKASPYGGLISSGHLAAGIAFGLFVKTGVLDAAAQGSPGMNVRWVRPIRPGDTIYVIGHVKQVSPAQKPGGKDAINLFLETFNQNDELVLTHDTLNFLRRRPL